MPHRALTFVESLRVAELQANRLLEVSDIRGPAVPASVICELPRLSVERVSRMPVSGSVCWSKGLWVIAINRREPEVRQRFSLAHEFKHVLDAPLGNVLYPPWRGMSTRDRAEHGADHFAACLLMPRSWVNKLYFNRGLTDLRRLAYTFEVSQTDMRIRLESMGLVQPAVRCAFMEAA